MPKANPYYTDSAVNLTNPEQIKESLKEYYRLNSVCQSLRQKITDSEDGKMLANTEEDMSVINNKIRDLIDQHGSYQDQPNGVYALKQKRVSLSYDPQIFRVQFPTFAPAVIKEIIDTTKLNGLIKGNLITEEELVKKGVASKSESFAYIIRV